MDVTVLPQLNNMQWNIPDVTQCDTYIQTVQTGLPPLSSTPRFFGIYQHFSPWPSPTEGAVPKTTQKMTSGRKLAKNHCYNDMINGCQICFQFQSWMLQSLGLEL